MPGNRGQTTFIRAYARRKKTWSVPDLLMLDLYRAATGAWETLPGPALGDRNRMYEDELSHFLDCVAHGRQPLVDGTAGLRVLAIVAAARQSLDQSRLG